MENRLEKRLAWAEGRKEKAAEAFEAADRATEGIPFGQPILIGHHSEARHRAAIERSDNAMRRGSESVHMAEHHEEKAAGIERQLESSIFSDDPDAIEALTAKADAIDAGRARCKVVNAAFRQAQGENSAEKLAHMLQRGTISEKEATDAGRLFSLCPYEHQPYPAYHLTNLGAKARTARQRIEEVKARTERAESAGGVLIVRHPEANWCTVTFAEKPDREILDALRTAGYRWGGGSWSGYLNKLPPTVS
jgi:hypothetical protein